MQATKNHKNLSCSEKFNFYGCHTLCLCAIIIVEHSTTEVILMHRFHDGPDESYVYLPLGPQSAKSPKTVVHATLAALQWAADREGVSYGRFTLNLSSADQSRIQAEYEAFISQRKSER